MNHQLSSKEKKSKRTEARRRAILWSERELRKKQLKQTQSRVETISISESENPPIHSSRHSDIYSLKSHTSSLPNDATVSSLQKTLKDLKIQRQELDITIKVLTNHIQSLQNKKSNSLKRNKPDGP